MIGAALNSLLGHPVPLLQELKTDTTSNKAKNLAINFDVRLFIRFNLCFPKRKTLQNYYSICTFTYY